MPHCAMRYCNNHTRRSKTAADGNGISFHKFPRPGHEKRDQWIHFVQNNRSEDMWFPSDHACVCSAHFRKEDMYSSKGGRRYLKKSAVPVEQINGSEDYLNSSASSVSSIDVYVSDWEYLCETPRKSQSKEDLRETPRKSQSKEDLRETTAANNVLIENNKKVKQQHRYLKSRKQKLTDVIKKLKSNFPVKSLIEHENKLLRQAAMVEAYINALRKCKQSKRNIRYSACVRKFALTLNYYSAGAYKYVRIFFKDALPHPRILSRWYGSFKAEPGFTEEAFKTLKLKSASALPEKPILCSLLFEEMSIRQKKLFKNKKRALVNFGNGPQEEKATQALVFMLVSLTENWKIPVGYFLVAGIGAETKATLINICLQKCHRVGVRVVNLIFDGCKANFNAAEVLGCQFSDVDNMKTHFCHPSTSENVYVFIDPCHVIKLVRNAFESKKILYDENNKKVKWQLLVNLNKLQHNEGLEFANKLSPRHIHFRNQVMKVKLATQLLSMSAGKTLELCDEVLKSSQFLESAATINFITLLNKLFEILNSQSPLCCKNKDNIFVMLDKVKAYILSLQIQVKQIRIIKRPNRPDSRKILNVLKKKVVESQRLTGFVDAIICIQSLKNMYCEMVEEKGIMTSICTYRLSLDHLELFFECVRKHGGNNNNPNVIQLQAAYKKILRHLELKAPLTRNCVPLDNFSILTTASVDIINSTSGANRHENEEFQVLENENKLLNSDIETSVNCEIFADKLNTERLIGISKLMVGYISGYVVRKLVKDIKCEECISNIMTNIKLWHHKLITLKGMGGQCYSSENVFQVCLKTESFIRSLIRENGGQRLPSKYTNIDYIVAKTLTVFLGSDIFQSMRLHSLQQPGTLNHRTHLIRAIIEKYSAIRLHHEASTDPNISFNTKRQKLNKLALFEEKCFSLST